MFKMEKSLDIVLIDFGISAICHKNKSTKIYGMTPAYCPPEIRFSNNNN